MKKNLLLIATATLFSVSNLLAQTWNSPVWTQTMTAAPDTAMLFPVKTKHDGSNNIYVLSTYQKTGPVFKIRLNKYNEFGNLLWSTTYDNNGIGNPRGFDMAIDNAGNCYIAGAFMFNSSFLYKPLILSINSSGSVAWMRDSTIAFATGTYDQVILKNNLLYLSSNSGVAVFNTAGSESWSVATVSQRITVDNAGRMIVTGFGSGNENFFRYNASGNLDFSDSTIYAQRIACDMDNSIYLLTDYFNQGYELVKYDSSGNFQWNVNTLPLAPPFGDIGFDVLVDYNNDVILVGLSDTLVKISPSGNLIWKKSMNGLDGYLISAEISFSNLIAVAGTVNYTGSNDLGVGFFDLNGNQNWTGHYDGSSFGQEFTVDMTIDNSGVYVVENLLDNSLLAKFDAPFLSAIDYSLICVDSVWYDTLNPTFINVRIFNGNTSHLNYPSVQIVNPVNNDTIGNPSNWVNFFAHLGNTYQVYSDTITQPGITDFTPFTFLISEGFGDTTVVITWCGPVGISELGESEVLLFPNPVNNQLTVSTRYALIKHIEIFDVSGRMVSSEISSTGEKIISVNVSQLKEGIYFLRVQTDKGIASAKFVKQ